MSYELVQILVPMTVFTAVVVALALLVLAARLWLLPAGRVEVVVNGRRRFDLKAGNKLLWELAEHELYLPAACGGRGTCGQCRIVVRQGAQALLPTEAAHIKRREASAGMRLACMTTVRTALEIQVPEGLLEAKRWQCRVVSNRSITTFLKELVLELPRGDSIEFEAGDYVLLEAPPHDLRFADYEIAPEYREYWQRYRLLELGSSASEPTVRAYSLANPPSDREHIVLVVRIATPPPFAPPGTPPGRASSYIFGLRAGDQVTVSGPFGDFHARPGDGEMIMVAGGAGIAPIRSIILDQLEQGSGRRISLWFGVRNRRELCYHDELSELAAEHENFSYHVALSECESTGAWDGHVGLIHDVLHEHYLRHHGAPEEAEYYLCGPPLMSAAMLQTLDELGVESSSIFFDDFGA